jgi:hypothetical protein
LLNSKSSAELLVNRTVAVTLDMFLRRRVVAEAAQRKLIELTRAFCTVHKFSFTVALTASESQLRPAAQPRARSTATLHVAQLEPVSM